MVFEQPLCCVKASRLGSCIDVLVRYRLVSWKTNQGRKRMRSLRDLGSFMKTSRRSADIVNNASSLILSMLLGQVLTKGLKDTGGLAGFGTEDVVGQHLR